MIRADEIDATLQAALAERMLQLSAKAVGLSPLEAQVKAAGTQALWAAVPRGGSCLKGAVVSLGLSLVVPPAMFPGNTDPMVALFVAMSGFTLGLGMLAYRKIEAEALRQVSPTVLRAAPYLIPLSRAEQLYCEALTALIDAEALLGRAPQEELLSHLNALLTNFRKLELAANHYRASAAASQPAEAIERELAGLWQRRNSLCDAAARETAEHSIRLCEQRLEQARRVAPVVERALAQQDLVLQTLASLEASLKRIKSVGTVRSEAEVMVVRESVEEINRQTRAMEYAVHEVMAQGAVGP